MSVSNGHAVLRRPAGRGGVVRRPASSSLAEDFRRVRLALQALATRLGAEPSPLAETRPGRACTLCGGPAVRMTHPPGWRCASPPCEWAMLDAADLAEGFEFDPALHPRGQGGQFAKKGAGAAPEARASPSAPPALPASPPGALEHKGDQLAQQMARKTSGLLGRLGAAGKWMKDKAKVLFGKLEARYGRKQAIAIFALGHVVGLATPLVVLPGSTMLGMVPFAALAEEIGRAHV